MRAVISASVIVQGKEGGRSSERFPTRSELRKALGERGLTPPALSAFRHRGEADPDAERNVFTMLAATVNSAARHQEAASREESLLGIDDGDGDLPSYSEVAQTYIPDGATTDIADTVRALASYALPVLTRMPARSVEDREKRRKASENLIFASTLHITRSLFVVSMENEGGVTFRLHHQLIERLQQGCEDLIRTLDRPIGLDDGSELEFRFHGLIEIYEVGQEDPTISGEVVGTTRRARLRYAIATDKIIYVSMSVLLLLFIVLFSLLYLRHLDHETVREAIVDIGGESFVESSDLFWLGQAQRLQSGVIPVLLVNLLTIVIRFPRGVVVRWSQRYGGDQ